MIAAKLRLLLFGTLRRQLILGVALVHALMMSLFVWDLTERQQDMLLGQQTSSASALAGSVATASAVWLAARDLAGLQEIVEAQLRYPGLSFAMILNRQGAILAHTDRQRRGQYVRDLPDRPTVRLLARSARLVDVVSPVMVAGRHVGWVRIGITQNATQSQLAKITRDGVLYSLAAIIVGALLAFLMANRVTRRLYAIRKVADAVQAGASGERVHVNGADEAAWLARDFNGMLDTLAERAREILSSHDALQLTQFAVDHTRDGVFWLDTDGRVLSANEYACGSLGYARDEMVGMHIWDFDPDFPASEWAPLFARIRQVGYIALETRHKRRDGTVFPVEVSASYVRYGDKEYGFSLVRDISERKLAERALQERIDALTESEERFRATFNQVAMGIAHVALGSEHWLRANRKFCEILGYSWEALQAHTLDSITHPDDRALSREYERKLLYAKVETYSLEKRYFRQDGSVVWVNLTVSLARDGHGNPDYLIKVIEDISVRKEAESKLRRINQLYRLLSEANAAIARTHDRDRLMESVCQITVDSGLFRMAWVGLLDPESGAVSPLVKCGHVDGYLDNIDINIYDSARGKGPTGTAIREGKHILCSDIARDAAMAPWREAALKRGYYASAVFPLIQEGVVVGAFNLYLPEVTTWPEDIVQLLDGLAEDLSFALDYLAASNARLRTERELRDLNAELEQRVRERTLRLEAANQELEAFSYSVSHDLRAPLRSIDGFSQILLKNYGAQLDSKGQDYLSRVRRASQRMGELIDDMLLLSRVARSEIHKEQVDLSALARSISAELKQAAPERVVEFVIADGIEANGDAKLLRILLENLLGNAWKFTAKKAAAKIEFGTQAIDGGSAVFVRDNGAGFNMHYANKLFQPFQRLHSMNEFEGTGIGLATVQRIIQRHGGRVWAEGEEGIGATFYFFCAQNLGREDAQ